MRPSRTTYREGHGPAMAKFIAITAHQGEIPADFADRPVQEVPGLPADDGSRNDAMFAQNLITCTHYEHDFEALRAASARVVIAVGAESEGQMARRSARRSPRGSARSRSLPQPPRRFPRRRRRDGRRAGGLRRHLAPGPLRIPQNSIGLLALCGEPN